MPNCSKPHPNSHIDPSQSYFHCDSHETIIYFCEHVIYLFIYSQSGDREEYKQTVRQVHTLAKPSFSTFWVCQSLFCLAYMSGVKRRCIQGGEHMPLVKDIRVWSHHRHYYRPQICHKHSTTPSMVAVLKITTALTLLRKRTRLLRIHTISQITMSLTSLLAPASSKSLTTVVLLALVATMSGVSPYCMRVGGHMDRRYYQLHISIAVSGKWIDVESCALESHNAEPRSRQPLQPI